MKHTKYIGKWAIRSTGGKRLDPRYEREKQIRHSRVLCLLLTAAMLASALPAGAFAASGTGLCAHHPVHTADCGRGEGTDGARCAYFCPICYGDYGGTGVTISLPDDEPGAGDGALVLDLLEGVTAEDAEGNAMTVSVYNVAAEDADFLWDQGNVLTISEDDTREYAVTYAVYGEDGETILAAKARTVNSQSLWEKFLLMFEDLFTLAEDGDGLDYNSANINMWLWKYTWDETNHWTRDTTNKVKEWVPTSENDGVLVCSVNESDGTYKGRDYCLIPVELLTAYDAYGQYGYTFTPPADGEDTPFCPLQYLPSANSILATGDLTWAEYRKYNGEWYVFMEEQGKYNADPAARLNVYFVPLEEAGDSENPANTVVNLFDYWITERDTADYVSTTGTDFLNQGINSGHELKFVCNTARNNGSKIINGWTGSAAVLTGIVSNTLKDGYPTLSGDNSLTGMTEGNNESLDYLFDPNYTNNEYRAAYRNVKGLLSTDNEGYYSYDSHTQQAYFSESTGSIIRYTTPGTSTSGTASTEYGQFFPFDEPHQAALKNCQQTNHYFGLTITTSFLQNYGGHTNSLKHADTTFEFSGDDDVWIFIDDVLVADLGGIHDAASVKINFVDGTVTINADTDSESTSTLKEAFTAAGKADDTEWSTVTIDGKEYTTFADNTTHKLKFFYLERGNGASNLSLKFNMSSIPVTSIQKTDQIAAGVPGAGFAVYKAEKKTTVDGTDSWEYLVDGDGDDGTYVDLSNSDIEYTVDSGTGVITYTDTSGSEQTITPVYTGVTDASGNMDFVDADGVAYSMKELEELFGTYFILREYHVPEGYRTVSDEVWLYVDGDVIFAQNPYYTGVWASPNSQVTATSTLYVTTEYNRTVKKANEEDSSGWASELETAEGKDGKTFYTVPYITADDDSATISTNGTLFAVVLKRNGRNFSAGYGYDYWYPVYGTNDAGYTVVYDGVPDEPTNAESGEVDYSGVSYETCGVNVAAAITAAEAQYELAQDNVFEINEAGTDVQVLLTGLPGKIDRYVTFLSEQRGLTADELKALDENSEGADPQYTVAYFWTPQTITDIDDWDGVTTANTVRVYSNNQTIVGDTEGTGYESFTTQWSTTIQVPNMRQRLYFQKLDPSGNAVDGAWFALYDAFEGDTDSEKVTKTIDTGTDSNGDGENDTIEVISYYVYYVAEQSTEEAPVYIYLNPDDDGDGEGEGWIRQNGATEQDTTPTVNYYVDAGTGKITVTGKTDSTIYYTIIPSVNADGESNYNQTSKSDKYISIDGTGLFGLIKNGMYLLREVKVPDGFELNPTETMVYVDDNGVFANAGTADNGVDVGNGVGYLTKTLDVFATQNSIDESLTWVYSMLLINRLDQTFSAISKDLDLWDVESTIISDSTWVYVNDDEATEPGFGNTVTTDRSQAMVTYLEYRGDEGTSTGTDYLFNYGANEDQDERYDENSNKLGSEGEGTIRLFTDQGWSALAVHQDYAYGSEHTSPDTLYEMIEDTYDVSNLSNLFSNLTMVRYTDQFTTEAMPSIKKIDQVGDGVEGAAFAFYKADYDEETGYSYMLDKALADGTTSVSSLDEYYIDPASGKVYTAEGGTLLITPGYYGETDATGVMNFKKPSDDPAAEASTPAVASSEYYTMGEMRSILGKYFILREVKVPEGYRTVYDETYLYFDHGAIFCDDVYQSGVWPAGSMYVTATSTLVAATEYNEVAEKMAADGNSAVAATGTGYYTINYYTPDSEDGVTEENTNGTLFAVVLKRDGRNFDKGYGYNFWYPVYGTNTDGYTTVTKGVPEYDVDFYIENGYNGSDLFWTNSPVNVTAAIEAIKKQQEYGESANVFTSNDTGVAMTLSMDGLPGKLDEYFTFLSEADEDYSDCEYTVAYYWTSASNVNDATENNTVRVYTNTQSVVGVSGVTYSAFTTDFSTTLEVPDMRQRLYVQKLDNSGNAVNGAAFALYNAFEGTTNSEVTLEDAEGGTVTDENGEEVKVRSKPIYYVADQKTDAEEPIYIYLETDTDGDNKGDAWVRDNNATTQTRENKGTYSVDSDTGTITVTMSSGGTTYTISPAKSASPNPDNQSLYRPTTEADETVNIGGSAVFGYLKNGQYLLREVMAPKHYALNTTETPVYVCDDGVFANAGTYTDGVDVGNGVGYLTKTLDVFATQGEISENLTWIYSMLLINRKNQTFEAIANKLDLSDVDNMIEKTNWVYVNDEDGVDTEPGFGSAVTKDKTQALVTYLEYQGNAEVDDDYLFNYAASADQSARNSTAQGENTIRLFTNAGWSALAVYQDYEYGSQQTSGTTQYEKLAEEYGVTNLSHLFSNLTMVRYHDTKLTGNLSVTKTVSGTGITDEDRETEFSFTVTLTTDGTTAADADGTYVTILTDADGTETDGTVTVTDGTASVTLKHGQTITIKDLRSGLIYTVTEANSEGYETESANATGTIPQDDETVAAYFTNRKGEKTYTSVSVEKVWTVNNGGKATDSVTVSLMENGTVYNTVTLSAANGWKHTWTGLDDGYVWTVEETKVPGFTADISGSAADGFVITNDDDDMGIPVKTGGLTVSKTVSGALGDTTKEFTFTVTLGSDTPVTGEYGKMTFTNGVASFKLKDGETMVAEDLPAGATFTVTESDNSGYTVTSLIGEVKRNGSAVSGTIAEDETTAVTFQNYRGSVPSTTYTSVSVKKVWTLDDGGAATDYVTVALLKDGVRYDTVMLNEANGWSHTWSSLDDSCIWTIEETDVPEGFTSSVTHSGTVWTITNDDMESGEPTPTPTPSDDPTPTPAPSDEPTPTPGPNDELPTTPAPSDRPTPPTSDPTGIPQTGQNWQSAWLLAALGLLLIAVGFVLKRKKENGHEDR